MARDNDFVIPTQSLSSTPIGDRDPDSAQAVWIRSLRGNDNSSGLPRTLAWQDGVALKPAQTLMMKLTGLVLTAIAAQIIFPGARALCDLPPA